MSSLATKKKLLLFFCPFLAAQAFAPPATAKEAKCLFEVDNVHYIGSVCEFTRTDEKGSFRINDTKGSGIEAEVKVTSPGNGSARWSDYRHKQDSSRSLGDVIQAGACWTDGSTYICAWSLDQDIYLGPYDKKLFVAYGERYGMDDEIESATGLDTDHAVIRTRPSRRAAIYYAVGQHDYAKGAAEQAFQERLASKNRMITANCPAKEWTGLYGLSYRLLGPIEKVDRSKFAKSDDLLFARWAVLDIKSNVLVDDCGACSYAEIHDWFKKLCPNSAPPDW